MATYHPEYDGYGRPDQYAQQYYHAAASLSPTDMPSHDDGADAEVASICAASLRNSYTDTDDVPVSPDATILTASPITTSYSTASIADAYHAATGKDHHPHHPYHQHNASQNSSSSDTYNGSTSGHRHTYSICSRRKYYASPSLPPPAITITADSSDSAPPSPTVTKSHISHLVNATPCAPVHSTSTTVSIASSHTYNNNSHIHNHHPTSGTAGAMDPHGKFTSAHDQHEVIEMLHSQDSSTARMHSASVVPIHRPTRSLHHAMSAHDVEQDKRAGEPRKSTLHSIIYNRDGLYRPLFIITMVTLQVIALAVELVVNYNLTGSVIAMGDQFNYLIGPSALTWIRTGARFTPCIKPTMFMNQPILLPGATDPYALGDLCGMGGFPSGQPNQWFRFILPIFLHGGVLHLLLNGLFQCHSGVQMEREWGAHRIAPIFLLGGMGGFLLGATVAPPQMISLGASGAVFALVGACLIELLQHWHETAQRKRQLAQMLLVILISLAFGLLPGVDNFAHIGGFLVGLLAGMIFLPQAAGRFWIAGRWVGGVLLIALFATLFSVFYLSGDAQICPWCRYLSCLPVNGWCDALAPPTPISSPLQ